MPSQPKRISIRRGDFVAQGVCPAKGRSKHECVEYTAGELASVRKDGYCAGLKDLGDYVQASPSIDENTKRVIANEIKLLESPDVPLAIFAGNLREATQYAEKQQLEHGKWFYVQGGHSVKGRSWGEFVKVGTWYRRKDRDQAMSSLLGCGFKELK